jgi:hypothetical protein
METIGWKIELLLEDVKRVAMLLEDATDDAELLESQPYQQARLLTLRRQLVGIELRLQNLRRELAAEKHPLLWTMQALEQNHRDSA